MLIHGDKTQILKKISFGQNKKMPPFFFRELQLIKSFTFNLRFLYELRHKARLFKTVCEIFHFRFRLVFIKVYIFVQQNACSSLKKCPLYRVLHFSSKKRQQKVRWGIFFFHMIRVNNKNKIYFEI